MTSFQPHHSDRPSSQDPIGLATYRQRSAADPHFSAWVDASAGSGKTRVLTDRVLRLLLQGVAPHQILCLTFTEAAAANMSIRLLHELSHWTTLDDTQLSKALYALNGTFADEEMLHQARTLFAYIVDAQDALRFQTFHGFCQSLLARFPLEANAPLGFKLLDEKQSAKLLQEAKQSLLLRSSASTSFLLEKLSAHKFDKMIAQITSARIKIAHILPAQTTDAWILEQCEQIYGCSLTRSLDEMDAAFTKSLPFDDMRRTLPYLQSGSVTEKKAYDAWLSLLEGNTDINAFIATVLTAKNIPKKPYLKATAQKYPEIISLCESLSAQCVTYTHDRHRLQHGKLNIAFLTLCRDFITTYQMLKERQVALDFDDLIDKAHHLLTQTSSAWVLYKLDGGISHVLVDEAQDTNLSQWSILEMLSEDFFTGLSARTEKTPERTVFAVGDYKQSIFSFQGADPDAFVAARTRLEKRLASLDTFLRKEQFIVSFRSSRTILDVVNAVFSQPEAGQGLGGKFTDHIAVRPEAGTVEIWPIAQRAKDDIDPADDDDQVEQDVVTYYAQTLADRVLSLKNEKGYQDGDFLVLVSKRDRFIHEFTRACLDRGIVLAGADRLHLKSQLVVEDVIALLNALLLPDDDLTLACVLKSPFIGMDETQLFELCAHRGEGTTLWSALQQHEPRLAQWFYTLMNQLDFSSPFQLLQSILNQTCPVGKSGYLALLSRLGYDAQEALNELITATLVWEQEDVVSLQNFVAWMNTNDAEIKRKLDHSANALRMMTVHGAKGLEAPVVILANSDALFRDHSAFYFDAHGNGLPLLRESKEQAPEFIRSRQQAFAEHAAAEYRRLLYVGLTRAERHLIIAGWRGKKASQNDSVLTMSWYNLIQNGFTELAGKQPLRHVWFADQRRWQGEGWIYTHEAAPQKSSMNSLIHPTPSAKPMLPETRISWLMEAATAEPQPSSPLSPSRINSEEEEPAALSPLSAEKNQNLYQRGTLIHGLLQLLPLHSPQLREEIGQQWLQQHALALSAEACRALLNEALNVLAAPEHAFLFGQLSRAEIPITGQLGRFTISGKIDRLAVNENEVWLVDFKTNQQPPHHLDQTPIPYLRQLCAYRDLLRKIYPSKTINSLILWTNILRLDHLPDSLLDRHSLDPLTLKA